MSAEVREIIKELKEYANPANVAGMVRFGINTRNTLGVNIPVLRSIARRYRGDHDCALQLWKTGIHEARLLAGFIDAPEQVTERQMEQWVSDFDSWDICDLVCSNLFDKTPFACRKTRQWPGRKEEYVKRAGFVLMAACAVHDKHAPDAMFEGFLPAIAAAATDERNFVKKAVNWALRQIGKRNPRLNRKAISAARAISKIDSRAARWIAADALRELTGTAVRSRIAQKRKGRASA